MRVSSDRSLIFVVAILFFIEFSPFISLNTEITVSFIHEQYYCISVRTQNRIEWKFILDDFYKVGPLRILPYIFNDYCIRTVKYTRIIRFLWKQTQPCNRHPLPTPSPFHPTTSVRNKEFLFIINLKVLVTIANIWNCRFQILCQHSVSVLRYYLIIPRDLIDFIKRRLEMWGPKKSTPDWAKFFQIYLSAKKTCAQGSSKISTKIHTIKIHTTFRNIKISLRVLSKKYF